MNVLLVETSRLYAVTPAIKFQFAEKEEVVTSVAIVAEGTAVGAVMFTAPEIAVVTVQPNVLVITQ